MKRQLLFMVTALLLCVGTVWADSFDDADAAYKQGDYTEAVKLYRLAAAQGSAQAQVNLGWMYSNGQGVPKDYVKAVEWYRKAAAEGVVSAQFNLGLMYANGLEIPKDAEWDWDAAKAAVPEKESFEGRDYVSFA